MAWSNLRYAVTLQSPDAPFGLFSNKSRLARKSDTVAVNAESAKHAAPAPVLFPTRDCESRLPSCLPRETAGSLRDDRIDAWWDVQCSSMWRGPGLVVAVGFVFSRVACSSLASEAWRVLFRTANHRTFPALPWAISPDAGA